MWIQPECFINHLTCLCNSPQKRMALVPTLYKNHHHYHQTAGKTGSFLPKRKFSGSEDSPEQSGLAPEAQCNQKAFCKIVTTCRLGADATQRKASAENLNSQQIHIIDGGLTGTLVSSSLGWAFGPTPSARASSLAYGSVS